MKTTTKTAIIILTAILNLTMLFASVGAPALSAATAEIAEQRYVKELGLDVEWFELDGYTAIGMSDRERYSNLCIIEGQIDEGHSKRGFINADTAEIVIPLQYDGAGMFRYGFAYIRQDNRRFIIDEAGNEVLDVSAYVGADPISDCYFSVVTLITVTEGYNAIDIIGKFGVIDIDGNEVLPNVYERVGCFQNSLLWAQTGDKPGEITISLFDGSGKPIASIECDELSECDDTGEHDPFIARRDEKWGIVSRTGEVIIPIENDFEDYYITVGDDNYSSYIYPYTGGLAAVPIDGKWGYLDREGNVAIPFQFEYASFFSEGLAAVCTDGKFGYIDTSGEIVIPCLYKYASRFTDGKAQVMESANGAVTYTYIGKEGNPLMSAKEYFMYQYEPMYCGIYSPNPKAPSNRDYKSALVDSGGNRLTDFIYGGIERYRDGLVVVSGTTGVRMYGIINQYGAEIIPAIFPTLEIVDGRTCIVGVCDKDGGNGRLGILKLPEDAATRKPPMSARPITVYLNGVDLLFETPPIIRNDRTMVPMRKIFETLGAKVSWDGEARKVSAVKGDVAVELVIGENTAFINGEATELDAPALILDNRTLVPLRFVAEAFDCDVSWDNAFRRVIINTAGV